MKIAKETIMSTGKSIGTGVLYGLAFLASKVAVEDIVEMVRYRGNVKYSDAVDVIMNSRMFSADKTRAISALNKDEDADYYRAVIRVVKSNMFSGDKVKTIAEMNKEDEAE